MSERQKQTVGCPRERDIIKVAGLDWEVTATFPVIRIRDDQDGYTVLIHRDGEHAEFTLWDDFHDGVEVYR